uniref:Cysteine rich protein 1 n=1 Tax=Canis lupus dingo TaxID=286419 RepID=A0A8C0K432_CANLU
MPKCPKCDKEVYFAERVTSLGKDWHRPCLKCEKCGKTLTSGGHAEHEGKPYCNHPCYSAMFGPKGTLLGARWARSHLSPCLSAQVMERPSLAAHRATPFQADGRPHPLAPGAPL